MDLILHKIEPSKGLNSYLKIWVHLRLTLEPEKLV